jgi:DNA-binding GntR family transcriptional regulator
VALRDRLVELRIPPGGRIDEESLTVELGLGRTPVREALRRLTLEGLVVVYPRRGTFASSVDVTSLSDITAVRAELEAHAAHRAATLADDADRRVAAALIAELDAVEPNQRSLIELDARVHRFVHRCSRNPYLAQDLDRYLNMSLRIWHLTFERLPPLEDRVREHRELLDAVRRGDAAAARSIARAHVLAFAHEMRAAL